MKSSLSEFVVNSSQLLDINAGNNKHRQNISSLSYYHSTVKLYVDVIHVYCIFIIVRVAAETILKGENPVPAQGDNSGKK